MKYDKVPGALPFKFVTWRGTNTAPMIYFYRVTFLRDFGPWKQDQELDHLWMDLHFMQFRVGSGLDAITQRFKISIDQRKPDEGYLPP